MSTEQKVHFYKYEGIGNDFVIIDNRDGHFNELSENRRFMQWLCDRNFGIGADAVLELRNHPDYDFEMIFTREEGVKVPILCANGCRCIVAFAHHLGVSHQGDKYHFLANDGPHIGWVDDATNDVHIKFLDMPSAVVKYDNENFYIDVGCKQHINFPEDLQQVDIVPRGRELGYDAKYMDERGGVHVMFVQPEDETDENEVASINIRCFEIGIDYEPLGCGTGAVASSIANDFRKPWNGPKVGKQTKVKYIGGKVSVVFDRTGMNSFENIFLVGPAKKSFEGVADYNDFLTRPEYEYRWKK